MAACLKGLTMVIGRLEGVRQMSGTPATSPICWGCGSRGAASHEESFCATAAVLCVLVLPGKPLCTEHVHCSNGEVTIAPGRKCGASVAVVISVSVQCGNIGALPTQQGFDMCEVFQASTNKYVMQEESTTYDAHLMKSTCGHLSTQYCRMDLQICVGVLDLNRNLPVIDA